MIESPAEKAWNNFLYRVVEIKKAKINLAEQEIQLYEELISTHRTVKKTKRLFNRLFRRK